MNNELKQKADMAKVQYKLGAITRDEAKKEIQPYIDAFNAKSKEIAKKWNQRPKLINLAGYLR